MTIKNLFKKIANGIGFYNPEMKIYSLNEEGNACKKIFDYLCDSVSITDRERFIRINEESKPIIVKEEIKKLEDRGYIKI